MTGAVFLVTSNEPDAGGLSVSVDDLLAAMRAVLHPNADATLDGGTIRCSHGDRTIRVSGSSSILTVSLNGWPRHLEPGVIEPLVRELETRGREPLDWRSADGTVERMVDPLENDGLQSDPDR